MQTISEQTAIERLAEVEAALRLVFMALGELREAEAALDAVGRDLERDLFGDADDERRLETIMGRAAVLAAA